MTADNNPLWLRQIQSIVSASDSLSTPEPATSPFYKEIQRMISTSASSEE